MSDQQESRDLRQGLTWDEMAEIDRRNLREGMQRTMGERIRSVCELSEFARRLREGMPKRP